MFIKLINKYIWLSIMQLLLLMSVQKVDGYDSSMRFVSLLITEVNEDVEPVNERM